MHDDIFFGGKTVLLVEDDPFTARKIASQLMALGVRDVLFAASLREARQHLETETVHVALLDVNLPAGETTVELGCAMSDEGMPVVFFSGFNAHELALAARGHEILEKPVSPPRLKAAMQRAMLRVPAIVRIKMAGPEARQSG